MKPIWEAPLGRHKVKITVVKRFKPSDVFGDNIPVKFREPRHHPEGYCSLLKDGQEFIVDEDVSQMPEGFCDTAWHNIWPNVRTLSFGGNFPWFENKGIAITCCIDGLRPVVFKLERV